MPKKSLGGRTVGRPPATHRDEFPAEYSLAGCSPAEPASAFSAMLILNQKLTRWLELFSERLLSPNRAVSIHAAVHADVPRRCPRVHLIELFGCMQTAARRFAHNGPVYKLDGFSIRRTRRSASAALRRSRFCQPHQILRCVIKPLRILKSAEVTSTMPTTAPQRTRALNLLKKRGMLRLKDFIAEGIGPETLARLVRNEAVVRPASGLYQLPEPPRHAAHTLAEAAVLIPKGVILLISALQFHELTLQAPCLSALRKKPNDDRVRAG